MSSLRHLKLKRPTFESKSGNEKHGLPIKLGLPLTVVGKNGGIVEMQSERSIMD